MFKLVLATSNSPLVCRIINSQFMRLNTADALRVDQMYINGSHPWVEAFLRSVRPSMVGGYICVMCVTLERVSQSSRLLWNSTSDDFEEISNVIDA